MGYVEKPTKGKRITELERRVDNLVATLNLRLRAENELNRRIDNLVNLVSELTVDLDAMRDNRNNSKAP